MPRKRKDPPDTLPGTAGAASEQSQPETLEKSLPFPIVAIGASAGGIEAFTARLKALPTDTGMAHVRAGRMPPEPYLGGPAPAIGEHLSSHYPVRARRRERHGLSSTRLWRALALVEERFDQPLAVEEMAEAVHLSPFHFARMFRRSTGMSPHAFVTRRRMEKAKELLATGGQSIAEIARAVGYRTQAHFTRVFHGVEGITPRRYRRDHKSGAGRA